ncbi:hypothetical protein SAMN05216296_0758 [Pseudomonas pohangensis]|jgi:hypothetical protein|uniref:Uncharacterized protein n=1 Tax=Pseudomonas pohangensis TaxID=364197 RepID=A0A1H2EG94_9PSED|nr:hypothetical protein [Pseudomonas pohangensis]SDT94175.1 hypothetical protein SAMN05216296_0758 [Pseudomonas pohangensis]
MNSTTKPSSEHEETRHSEPVAVADGVATTPIKPFSFPFSPEVFAPTRRNDKPWHQQGNKSNHDQRPGAAPKGTRRSMGKR